MWSIEQDIWRPSEAELDTSNLAGLIRAFGCASYDDFLTRAKAEPANFWSMAAERIGVEFDPPPAMTIDLARGDAWATFFRGAGFNFAASCIAAPGGGEGVSAPAIIWENEAGDHGTISYAALASRTRNVAAGLLNIGVQAGDRVGLLFPNTPEAVIALLAVGYIGAIAVPLFSGFGGEAVARRLEDSNAEFLMTAAGFVRRGKHISLADVAFEARELMSGRLKIVLAGALGESRPHQSWQSLEEAEGAALEPAPTLATDPFMVIYTSGTSGKPKGAVHAHAGFPVRVAQDVSFVFDFREGDRYFWYSDMGWMVGPFSICSTLLLKGALVLYDGAPNAPDFGRLRAVAARASVTHFGSTPTAIRAMAADEDSVLSIDAPSLRILMTGGEVMDPETHRWFYKRFGYGRLPVLNYSGGTEVSGALLTNVLVRDIQPCRFNSTAPGVPVDILADGSPASDGEEGELIVGGPFNGKCSTFWRDDDRYLDTYWSQYPGVWAHGDLAVREEDGQYLIIGRADDVMKLSGKRVGPTEVEGVVTEDHRFVEAAAFSVPDERTGERMVLLLVLAGGRDLCEDEAAAAATLMLKTKMGSSYKPSEVAIVPRLLRTKNGKLVRRLAKQAWLDLPAGDLSAVEAPEYFEELRQLFRQRRGRRMA